MKKLCVLLFFCLQLFGQEKTPNDSLLQTNPIIFAEIFGAVGGGTYGSALMLGYTLNYQLNRNDLLTFRSTAIAVGKREDVVIGYVAFPAFLSKEVLDEYAFMYGKRWIDESFSVSISSGFTYVNRYYYEKTEGTYEKFHDDYIGLPFDVSVKWFKSKKSRFRAYYGIIPIGKRKVAFGRSFGFKLTGTVARSSYFGIGISYGFGVHKRY
jgi:hypothetical protein